MKIAVLQHIASADQRGHILGVQDVSFHRVIGTFRIYRNSIQRPALIEREFFNFSNAGRNMHSRNAQIGIEGLLSDFRYRLAAQHRRNMHLRAFPLICRNGGADRIFGEGKVLFTQRGDILLFREHLAAFRAIAAFRLAGLGVGGFHRRQSCDSMHVVFPLPAVFLRPSAGIGGGGAADQYVLRDGGRIDFQNAVGQKHRDDLFLSCQRISGNARNPLHDLHILGNRGQRQNRFRAVGAVHDSVNGLIESSAEILQFRQAVAIPEGHGLVILQTGRQRNGGKPPALGKCLHPNVFQPGWQRNTGQILAALEHLFFNAGQAFR